VTGAHHPVVLGSVVPGGAGMPVMQTRRFR